MALLSVEELDLAFGDRPIFVGASLALQPRDRLGIVGPNGAGKSTLLKILAGDMEPDGGRISRSRGCRVGYLPQEHSDPGSGALLDTVLASAPGRDDVNERIAAVESELEQTDDTDRQIALAQELAELHTRASVIDGQFGPHRAQSILAGLGFAQADFTRSISEFSGGWRMRASLAELLYQLPDVLLLDEPTNHLDMPSVAWLSDFLKSCNRAVILTCHDREFLNRHVNRIASLEIAGLRTFRGNYDEYLVQRELELEHLEARQRKDEQRRKELEAFVERFRAKATKARQAQSKAKIIEKLQAQQTELPEVRRPVKIQFPPAVRTGSTALTLSGVGHAYGSHQVFEGVDLQVSRGDRIAVVGVNGAGKTTLLRIAAGDISPTAGEVRLGHNVTRSYFAQHQAEILSPTATVLDEVHAAAPHMSQTQARGLCGAFLFSGDDVDKPIAVLSGGEKTRVALACMLAAPANLLLLDEPTNHLDTESADKLTESLQDYDGTLMFVSHNLDFARRLSNKVWDVSSGKVEIYPGSLGEYLEHLEQRDEAETPPSAEKVKSPGSNDAATRKEARKAERTARIRKSRERGALQKRIEAVEAQIAAAEDKQQEIESQLANPGDASHDALRALGETYEATKAELEEAFSLWEQLSGELELH